mgnify:CR=1 FL=1
MADVEFYEPDAQLSIERKLVDKQVSPMILALVKAGIVKDERIGKHVLFLIATLFFILSFIIFSVGVSIRPKTYFVPGSQQRTTPTTPAKNVPAERR